MFVTATVLSKDLTDKIRTESSRRSKSKGRLLKEENKERERLEKSSVGENGSSSQVRRGAARQPEGKHQRSKGIENRAAEELRDGKHRRPAKRG